MITEYDISYIKYDYRVWYILHKIWITEYDISYIKYDYRVWYILHKIWLQSMIYLT